MRQCPGCGLTFSDPSATSGVRECPNCGHRLDLGETRFEGAGSQIRSGLIQGYFRDVWRILTSPTAFFREMPLAGGLGYPLAFALITHWLGAALMFLWSMAVGKVVGNFFTQFFQIAGNMAEIDSPGRRFPFSAAREQFGRWVWGPSAVILDPFKTLLTILIISFFVFLGSRLLVPRKSGSAERTTYESALRLVCFGMTPSILNAIPIFGPLLAIILNWIVTVIGAREIYRVSSSRATVIGFFPQVLFMSFLLLAVLVALVVFFKFLSAMF